VHTCPARSLRLPSVPTTSSRMRATALAAPLLYHMHAHRRERHCSHVAHVACPCPRCLNPPPPPPRAHISLHRSTRQNRPPLFARLRGFSCALAVRRRASAPRRATTIVVSSTFTRRPWWTQSVAVDAVLFPGALVVRTRLVGRRRQV
jgi:hypothetical protein